MTNGRPTGKLSILKSQDKALRFWKIICGLYILGTGNDKSIKIKRSSSLAKFVKSKCELLHFIHF